MTIPADATIHDIGYRRYDGSRLGARGAWMALWWQGVRAMFGLGRPAKAKLAPVFVLVVTLLPCLALLAASSASGGQIPIRYGPLLDGRLILLVLFAAAQVPEVLSRDQQHRVLPLILTRDVTRVQYASARLMAVISAMLLVALSPLLLLYIGEIGVAKDPAAAFAEMGDTLGPVLLHGTLTAWVIGSLAAMLASLTSRRAYATASIIGAFLVASAIATGLDDLAGVSVRAAELLDPIRALRTMGYVLFEETTRGMELNPPPSLWVYASLLTAIGAASAAGLLLRIRRLSV